MSDITLESLIQEHKDRIPLLQENSEFPDIIEYPDMREYYKWISKTTRFLEIKFPKDKHIEEFNSECGKRLYYNQQLRLLAILEAFNALPNIVVDSVDKKDGDAINVTTTINNTNSQSQSQEQSLAVELFIEAIKDDLTGRQIKELKSVVAEADNDLQKARPGVLAKLNEFGTDVASNIVANLLTNPMIWGGL